MRLRIRPRHDGLRWKRLARAHASFRRYLKRDARTFWLAVACAVGAISMQLLRPWPLKLVFDGVLMPEAAPDDALMRFVQGFSEEAILAIACAALLAVSVLWGLFNYGQAYLTARAGQGLVYDLRARAYAHLQRLSLGFHRKRKRGDLQMRLTGDINSLRDLVVDSAILAMSSVTLLLFMLTVLFAMDWKLALAVVAVIPFVAAAVFRFSFEIRESARNQRRNEGRVASMVNEMLNSIELIQAFGNEDHSAKQFGRRNKMSFKSGLRTTRLEASMARVVEVMLGVATALVLFYGVARVRAGALTPGDLLVFTAYAQGSFRPLRRLARVSSRVSKAVVCAERVTDFLDETPEIQDAPDAKRAEEIAGAIELRRVRFTYPSGQRALRKVSLEIEPGSFVGIVGPSGAGKSSLLALLLRLYDPNEGKILLDGRDLRRYRVQSLREQIGVVLQEPLLLGGTVAENIAFGVRNATPEDIERAARRANAHKFIKRLPNGYETSVAETGASLSGGQRQRICIARAFLRDAPILIMDEPTFGLDADAEREVLVAVERLVRDRTAIVVAHRLATLRNADRIFVLQRGQLEASGTHAELLASNEWYATSCSQQEADVDAPPPHLRPVPFGGRTA